MNVSEQEMMDVRIENEFAKTALFSVSVPGGFGVGSAYLDALLRSDYGDRIRMIHPPGGPQRESGRQMILDEWPLERYRPSWPGRFGSIQSVWHYRRNRNRIARSITNRIALWCQREGVQRIWAVLESPLACRVSALLAATNQFEMVATVWDPPESVARQHGLDRISRRESIHDFDSAIAGCARLGVISEPMADHFQQSYPAVRSTVMRMVPDVISEPLTSTSPNREFIIAFAGSLYASDEFAMLLSALDSCDWMVDGRNVRVKILGERINYRTKTPACIEFLGYRNHDEVLQVMASADCGYVPYWFDRDYENAVRMCFPSKLITCLVSHTPIFFHGPENSTPAEFLNQYSAGVACHATSSAGIVCSLQQLAKSDRSAMIAEAVRALAEEFNHSNFIQRFQYLIAGNQHDGSND